MLAAASNTKVIHSKGITFIEYGEQNIRIA